MKLLLDQNLSHHLIGSLAADFPGSVHVRDLGLREAEDQDIWALAIEREYIIVSKDEDFAERALVEGPPPKVVWIQLGNCSTQEVEVLLQRQRQELSTFAQDEDAAVLPLP